MKVIIDIPQEVLEHPHNYCCYALANQIKGNYTPVPDVEDTIQLDKVKQAREEINKLLLMSGKDTDSYRAYYNSIEIINMLIESED